MESSGIWTATYTITAGVIDASNRNVSVSVTNGSSISATTIDNANATVDNVAPTVTDANISISGATGTGGAYKIGDTVTASWNNTAGGDNNSDTISGVTVNFSAFGGGSAVAAINSSGIWTATYTITAGAVDAVNLNVSVTATDNAGNITTTADTANATVDSVAPTVTDANISISGATGTGGAYKIGDTVTASWNNTAGGDNNSDTISGVTVNFSAFGGGTAVAATDSAGIWTATFTLTAGTLESTSLNVSVTTTDNAGNTTTGADTSNASVDTLAPVISSVSVPANGTYGTGQSLGFTVNTSQAITIDTSGGTPRLALTIGSSSVFANYVSGSNTSALLFSYTVQAGDLDSDGISVGGLESNGGALRDAGGNNLTLTLNSVGSTTDVLIDAVAPTVTSVGVPGSSTYVAGEALTFTVNTSETVIVDTTSGTPTLALTIGSTPRVANYVGGSNSSALTFSYTVQSGDFDDDGITVGLLAANSGTIRDATGNNLALTLNSVGSTSSVLVDAVLPTLVSLSPADNSLAVAPNANLVITLSEGIALGAGVIAIYDSEDVLFTSIDVTNHDDQLSITDATLTIDLAANLLEDESYYVQIASGAITDLAGNAFSGITDSLTWNFAVADITPPAVVSVAVSGSPAANAGAIQFTVTFDEVPAGVTTADFVLTSTGSADADIASVSPVNGNTVTVTIDTILGTGTLRLDVVANSGITDGNGNGNGTNGYVAAFTSGGVHTVDRDAPAVPATPALTSGSDSGESSTDGITNIATPTFTGTAEANATVTIISSEDGSLGTTVADGSGNWSFTPSIALSDATHSITITATDTAGNVSTASDNLTVQIDTSTPSGHSVSFGDTVYNGSEASAASFTFTAAEVGATYSYVITSSGGGIPVTGSGTVTSATETITNLNLAGLSDGTLTLSVTLTDTAGNAAAAVTANATLDTALPSGHSVSFGATHINNGNANAASFSFADAEVGASYSYTITSTGGGTPVVGSGTLSSADQAITGIDLSGLADGTLTLSVVLVDASGNAASAVTSNVILDQTAPSVSISSTAGATVNSTFDVTIAFNESVSNFVLGDITAANSTLSGFADNGGGNFSVIVTPTADGAVTLNVAAGVAQDAAGNNNTAATQLSRTYDGTAPTLSSSIPADGASNVAGNTNLVLTFSEPVVAGSGDLTLFDAADNSVVEVFAVNGVTISSNVLTLDPASDLIPTHSYYLQIAGTALLDTAGNAYAGIADATTLNFTVANAAPVAGADNASVAEDASVDIVVLANDTDSDSSLNAASVTVVTAPQNGTTSVNTATGVVTYTPAADFNGSDSFSYTVEDVHGSVSNVAVVSVTVTPVNDAPVAVGDIATTAEDNPISIDVAANDTDIDVGDSVDGDTIIIVSAPAHGSATVVNGEVLYTPSLDYTGSDSFTYTIEDSTGATSNVATVIVNVTGVNDLPVAAADTATVDEDSSVDIDVLANDSDVDGTINAATVQVLTNPAHGTAEVDALTGEIAYTPAANFHGSDSFTYVVQDNAGGTSNPATVTVTVNSVNDAPVANADTAIVAEDTAHTINVLGNDSDIDGTLVLASVEVVTTAQSGTTQVNPATGAIVYTPGENFSGSDSFTYRVQDNQGAWSNVATVTITVQAVNDEPLANPDSITTAEDTEVTIDVLANDSDVDGTLDSASLILTQPANGVVVDNGDGTVSYTPAANFFGSDSFTYTVADNEGGVSNTATVTITVDAVNDEPVISGSPAVSVNQDSAYSFTPTASDVDNATLTFSIANAPTWATFNTATGALGGTPGNNDVGSYSGIVITVSDGLLSASLPAFAIEVINVNDPPQIGGTPSLSINQDGSYSFVPNVVDVDGDTTFTFSVVNLPSWASFDPATGAITGTPGNSDVGTYNNIVISVSDGLSTTTLGSFSITVANVNDAPVPAADAYSLSEGGLLQRDAASGVLANDVDIDGDVLTAAVVTGPRNASQFALNADGSFTYQHNGSETRVDSFTYRISDGAITSAPVTVNLTIAAVNDPPAFVTSPMLATLEGAAYRYDVGVTDPDSVVNLSLLEGAPEWLSLSGNTLSGNAPLNETGVFPIVLRATDGEYTVDQSFNLTVAEQEATLVNISTRWQGLPSIVGNTVDLFVTLTHVKGPALTGASLAVNLRDVATGSSMERCTAGTDAYACPVNLAAGASTSFRLRLTPSEKGNLIVNLDLSQGATNLAATITDVSVSERAVSQGDVTFNLANATALASINLLNDGVRELVAGTSLGDTIKLLNYSIANGTAVVIGEIENRGYNNQVRVADIDRDGLEDILVVNRSGAASAIYYDRGGEFVQEPTTQPLPHAREAVLYDLNGDDYPEMILGAGGFNLYIYENNAGVYDKEPLVFSSLSSILHFALLNRMPGDAAMEGTLVIASATAVQLVRFGVNPDGGINEPADGVDTGVNSQKFELLQSLDISGVSSVQLVDIDGDGQQEIVVSTTHDNNSADASGVTVIALDQSSQLQVVARLGAASAKKVEVADFNGDGVPDLLVANDNNSYQFYRGTGSLSGWTMTDTILYHSSTLVVAEDVNGDGLADVLVYEDGDAQVELYLSTPEGDTGEITDLMLTANAAASSQDRYRFAYTLNISNQGELIAENVRVNVPLPAGVRVVNLPNSCTHDEEVNEVNCVLPDLEASEEETIVLTLKAMAASTALA
ncbi:MAG: tandem-95 repeat protein [Cellvibrionaceae bacterium]|nr:tandem-95 repeat protein [Cellvibrionaceae bacterium]